MRLIHAAVFVAAVSGCHLGAQESSYSVGDPFSDPVAKEARPFIRTIEDALTKGEEEKAASLRQILCDQLATESEQVRGWVFGYLRASTTRIRFFDFERCLASKDASYQRDVDSAVDWNQLLWADEATAVGIYTRCIISGEVRLWRGETLLRFHCMGAVASGGLVELKPLVDEYYDRLSEADEQVVMPHSELTAFFEMSGGSGGPDLARTRAVNYLAKMEPQEAVRRLRNDNGFAKAIEAVAIVVCRHAADSRCHELSRVAETWGALDREQRKAAGENVDAAEPPEWARHLFKALEPARAYQMNKNVPPDLTFEEYLKFSAPPDAVATPPAEPR